MGSFPRTLVGGASLPRLLVGTNWLLGYSHCTAAKDSQIREKFADPRKIADVIEVFFRAGVDAVMGPMQTPPLLDGIREAEDRTGVEAIIIATPSFTPTPRTPFEGFDPDEVKRVLDKEVEHHSTFCMPHTSTTDAMVDRCTREGAWDRAPVSRPGSAARRAH